MEIAQRLKGLYEKDTKDAYASLLELEALSEGENTLYPYCGEFLSMLKSERYIVRVRGFRLLCKQAKWDREGLIDSAIEDILAALDDEKPTAVRQALQYLAFVVPYKRALCPRIAGAAQSLDCARFKDTMRPLIEQDIRRLVQLTGAQ